MSNLFLKKMFIYVFSLSIPAAFAEPSVFNRYPVTSNNMNDLPGKRLYLKIYGPEMARGTTLMRKGRNSPLYYGKLKIGSDDQVFKIIFDTGSSEIWIPGTTCNSTVCSAKNRFDPHSSSSFVDSNHRFGIKYESGKISGIIGYDDITLGGIKVVSQEFIVADTLADHFHDKPFDGIFGLGYKKRMTPWLDNAVQQGLIDKAVFSFYLSNTPNKGGSVMIVGEPDPSYYQGSISWHNLTAIDNKPLKSYYNISFDGISVGEKNIPLSCQPGQCIANVDTGAAFMYGPARYVESILESIDVKPDCSNISQLPPLKVSIDGHIYVVPPQFYVIKSPNCFEMVECKAAIGRMNFDLWVLGDPFIRAFYTVFDKTNKRVGFARLHDRLKAPKTLRAL